MRATYLLPLLAVASCHSTPTVYWIRHGEKPESLSCTQKPPTDTCIQYGGLSARGWGRAHCLATQVFGAGSQYDIRYIIAQKPKCDDDDDDDKSKPTSSCSKDTHFPTLARHTATSHKHPPKPTSTDVSKKNCTYSDCVGRKGGLPFPGEGEERPYLTVMELESTLGLTVDTSCKKDKPECVSKIIQGLSTHKFEGNILVAWEHEALAPLMAQLALDVGKSKIVPPCYPGSRFDIIYRSQYPYNVVEDYACEKCSNIIEQACPLSNPSEPDEL